ncbi:hypothetical protein WMY93_031718 [Mugilogobius chulae]|uniref:WAPL domain-containing protein n=1 Tax=Mugilogobius chulae TaxID=88201 RepID=A0AAW0MGY5_9GOBI
MTSRFGKTYNRKGGEANSRFEEVFSNRKPTLSTKWGETTYKAQLGAKRPVLKSDVSEISKRPRLEDSDSDQDPFGFDSDDESKIVTTHIGPDPDDAVAVTNTSTPQQKPVMPSVVTSSQLASTTVTTNTNPSEKVIKVVVKSNQPWYKIASDSSQKPTSSISHTISSANQNSATQSFLFSSSTDISLFGTTSNNAPGGSRDFLAPSACDDLPSDEMMNADSEAAVEPPPQPVDNIPPSPFTLRASNSKKYQRPNRAGKTSCEPAENNNSDDSHGTTSVQDKSLTVHPASSSSTAAKATTAAKPAGRGGGRVRDYTVLHPSCVSICNVTIQDSIERNVDELVAPAPPADLGEAGQMKKKTDAPLPKHARYRPTPAKPKKTKTESKLEFFGFEDKEEQGGEEGSESATAGKSSYKIKYFGFDDLSESDSDDDSTSAKEKKHKKTLAALSSGVDSPQTSDSQDSQASSNTDAFDFADDSSPSGTETQKARLGKTGENPRSLEPKRSLVDQKSLLLKPCTTLVTGISLNLKSCLSLLWLDLKLLRLFYRAAAKTATPIKTTDIVTALKCRKEHKELYTVVQHVKHFNDVVEFGENQEFTDDFEYLETGLKSSQPLNTRCLSIIGLATRCAMPSFRMHLRARGKVAHVFKILSDAPQHPTGHLAMETLLSLTSKRAGDWFKEELRLLGGLDHIVDKVKECVQLLNHEEDKENLVASLWGAERCLRVLESVTVQNPENQGYLIAYKDSQLIISAARALRHCEDMIQRYSRALNNSSVLSTDTALPHCSFSNVGKAVEDCMRAVIGVLLNLTHDNEWGSTKTGEQELLIVTALNCVLRVPRYIPPEQRFDVRVLGLGLLINLVEYSSRNRHCLVDMEYSVEDTCLEDSLVQPAEPTQSSAESAEAEEKPKASGALAALVKLFLERERAAILAEAKTDDLISEAPKPAWTRADSGRRRPESDKKEEEDEELDLNKALQHAGKHMEDSIVASYTALLLGCLCQGSQINVTTVREHLPKGDFSIMTEMLKKFLNFMNLTCAMGTTGQKSISRVIDYLEHC